MDATLQPVAWPSEHSPATRMGPIEPRASPRCTLAPWRPPHRISHRLAARLLRLPLEGGVIPAVQTGDVVYTLDREHGLHRAKRGGGYWLAPPPHHRRARSLVQASRSLPPGGGVGEPGRSPQSSRRGGTRRPVSDDQRHYRRQGGGCWLAPPPHQPSPAARLLRLPLEGGVILERLGQEALCRPQDHSPLEGESARPGRSPQSSRRGGTRRPVSDDQRHYRRQGGGCWLAPPPHQPSPAARLLRLPLEGGVIHVRERRPGMALCKPQDHSPLEGESARPGRSPQSSRRGGKHPGLASLVQPSGGKEFFSLRRLAFLGEQRSRGSLDSSPRSTDLQDPTDWG